MALSMDGLFFSDTGHVFENAVWYLQVAATFSEPYRSGFAVGTLPCNHHPRGKSCLLMRIKYAHALLRLFSQQEEDLANLLSGLRRVTCMSFRRS